MPTRPGPLKLSDAAGRVEDGDVALFRGRKWYSRVIGHWTRSVYSHASMLAWAEVGGRQELCAVEAMEPHGVRVIPLRVVLARGERVEWYQLVEDGISRWHLVAFALDQWGKRYASPKQFGRSFLALWSRLRPWLAGRLPGRVGRWLGADDTNPDRFFCSELVTAAYREAGYVHWEGRTPARTVPGEVARFTCLRPRGPITL